MDTIGVEQSTGHVVLTILDALEWSDPDEHLEMLQSKLNTYLRFEESGELYSTYPKAKGRSVVIHLITAHELPPEALQFLDKVRPALANTGIEFRTSCRPPKSS